jgi:hypothetical protein
MRTPAVRSTAPDPPNSVQGRPVRPSSAINRASSVPMKIRCEHGADAGADASIQDETPREVISL